MKILVVFLISSFILFSQDKSPIETLSLDEALTIGIKNNRNIITANLEVQKAYKEKWNTIATGLPQIKASVDYQNFIKQPISLIPAEFFGGNKGDFAEVSFGTKQNINAGLKLDQLIFDGSYLVGLQAIKVFLEESKNFREKTIIEVKKSIVSTYSSVLSKSWNTSGSDFKSNVFSDFWFVPVSVPVSPCTTIIAEGSFSTIDFLNLQLS